MEVLAAVEALEDGDRDAQQTEEEETDGRRATYPVLTSLVQIRCVNKFDPVEIRVKSCRK